MPENSWPNRTGAPRQRPLPGCAIRRPRSISPRWFLARAKSVCVGLNYRHHILEMGRGLPEYPTLFGKFADALIGPRDAIQLPPESSAVDWEAELAVVIGRTVRRADENDASAAIAGFCILNDVTIRDWQYRTTQWLQGKTFEATTPLGPALVTPDELPGGVRPALQITGAVNGETVQKAKDLGPGIRSRHPGPVHLHDHDAAARRPHRHRHTRRRRPRPEATPVPRGGDNADHRN